MAQSPSTGAAVLRLSLRYAPLLGILLLPWYPQPQAAEVRALLVPKVEAMLAAEMSGRIIKLPLEEGDRVTQGQLLAAYDCTIPRARLAKAQAERQGAQLTLESNRKLSRLGSFSQLELALSEVRLQEVQAQLDEAKALADKCLLHAPFGGRLAELKINNHESLSLGQEMMELLDDRSLRLTLFVPSQWLRWIASGQTFHVTIGETGQQYPAKIVNIGARVDPVSQSIEIQGIIEGEHPELLAGMSGEAVFTPPEDQ